MNFKKPVKILFYIITLLFIFLIFSSCIIEEQYNENCRTYYVSSLSGSLENDGLSAGNALLSIEQVNNLDLKPGDTVLFERGSVFRGNLLPVSGTQQQKVTYSSYGQGSLPVIMGSVSIFDLADKLEKLDDYIYGFPCNADIGNVIINEGEAFGIKKFALYDLVNPLDYFYDRNSGVFFIYADQDIVSLINGKSSQYYSVEFCVTQNLIDLSNKHDIVFKELEIKNGGAHGFGGSEVYNVLIEGCCISYMGGGFLKYDEDNNPVRYGNGVEFYNSAAGNAVDSCEIFEIFDTAVTNQGSQNGASQTNISYTNNVIYNCGMSAFELWLKGKNTVMSDIAFSGNQVSNIGYGFSSSQNREDNYNLGYFIINFGSDAQMSNICIENNTFNGIYNAYGYDCLLLDLEISTDIEDDEMFKGLQNNEVSGAKYHVIYSIDGELFFLE